MLGIEGTGKVWVMSHVIVPYNRYSCEAKEFETTGLETQQDERGTLHDSMYSNNRKGLLINHDWCA